MVTRYEEYLPHREDEHGRFCAAASLAWKAGFLDQPVVDQWARLIRRKITERFPKYEWSKQLYTFVQTVDIDAAWRYLHKGTFRTLVGMARDLFSRHQPDEVLRRIKVLMHKEEDPYDTFDYIIDLHKRTPGSYLLFFVLLADYGQNDKPASYLNRHTRELVQHLGDYAKMGLHPGYQSLEHPIKLDTEKKRLEAIIHRMVVRGRYHFYDLERDHENDLLIHPFCVMDTTLKKYLRKSPDEGLSEYKKLIDRVREVDGSFCCIVHNQNLNELDGWAGWKETYEKMVEYAGNKQVTT